MPTISRADITGLVLAGGRGSRMGGVDKGRQPFRGVPLAEHAYARLVPQVGPMLISANRHLDAYRRQGTVVTDTMPDFAGPLAGILAGLQAAQTPYLACVPCDSPFFPDDLVGRLAQAFAAPGTNVVDGLCAPSAPCGDGNPCVLATAAAPDIDHPGQWRSHPVFALMRTDLAASLAAYLADGGRRLNTWRTHHNGREVTFSDAAAFYNVNTLQALETADDFPNSPSSGIIGRRDDTT